MGRRTPFHSPLRPVQDENVSVIKRMVNQRLGSFWFVLFKHHINTGIVISTFTKNLIHCIVLLLKASNLRTLFIGYYSDSALILNLSG